LRCRGTEPSAPSRNSPPAFPTHAPQAFSGTDDNLWFTEHDGNRIGRIIAIPANGTVGTITEFSAGISGAVGQTTSRRARRQLWLTEYDGNRIGKIIALPTTELLAPSPNSIRTTPGR
jgi:hypothetical protein